MINVSNSIVHATVVVFQAPVPLTVDIVVCEGCRLEYGQKTKRSPNLTSKVKA